MFNKLNEHEWVKIKREEIIIKYNYLGQGLNNNIYYKINVTKEMIDKEISKMNLKVKASLF